MTSSAPAGGTLRRTLGLWQVSLSGIGVILGAGVYAWIGPAAALAGNLLWMSFLLAGLTAALTAYAYAACRLWPWWGAIAWAAPQRRWPWWSGKPSVLPPTRR